MCYVKTTILNNIKVVDSYKIKSPIKYAMDAFLNSIQRLTNMYTLQVTKSNKYANFQNRAGKFFNTIHIPKLSTHFTWRFQYKLPRKYIDFKFFKQ
jgi:hypothetical protein